MRNNLLFYNIPEEEDETKNTKAFVHDVIEKIGIDPREVEIDRAHRMGKNITPGKPRPIVAKFLRYNDREDIRRNAYKLKGTKIGIAEQFPKEIAEKRKALYPVFRQVRAEGRKAKLVKDQLFIDGQKYIGSGV